MKKRLSTVLIILMLIVGLSLLLYPSFSNYWNSLVQSRVITGYLQAVDKMDEKSYAEMIEGAHKYNEALYESGYSLVLNDEQRAEYEKQLDILGNGMMGYIEIPKINCFLPIYHGTSDTVLQIAAGHIEGSSLPVGGESTHAVISGHRGLPSSILFTYLDSMETGDRFVIQILNETLTYEVDRIMTVLPHEMQSLAVEEGKDYCTLMTCTPYGINTHRLLVRGHRTETEEKDVNRARIAGDALVVKPSIAVSAATIPIMLVLFVLIVIRSGGKKQQADKKKD